MQQHELNWKLAVWFCLALVVGACFGGDFVQGLPCDIDADCGPQLSCIEGNCGGLGEPALCGNGLRDVGEECDDGNVIDGDDCSADCLLPAVCGDGMVQGSEACDDGNGVETDECKTNCTLSPDAPTLELSLAQVKQFEFSWEPAVGAEYYQLYERVNEGVEFVQVGEDIEGNSYSLTVPLYFRVNASYKLYACNTLRCVGSDVVNVEGALAEAVGYFKASNTTEYRHFGGSVALSGDGNTLAVGTEGAGAVYVFVRTGEIWSQQAYVEASNTGQGNDFGHSVVLSGNGNTLAVGDDSDDSNATGINHQGDNMAQASGAVYVFVRTGGSWSQQAYIKASNTEALDQFGNSVALSGDGDILAVGADNEGDAGAVYVFVRSVEIWSQQAYVKASNTDAQDRFGSSVALSGDGQTLAVGAEGEGSIDGKQDDNSASGAGAVYVFGGNGKGWNQQAYVKASNIAADYYFGGSVALSGDGNTLAVGASSEGSNATGINNFQDNGSADASGAVYVFVRGSGIWSQQAYVKASNTGGGDEFGTSIALSGEGDILAVGAQGEDSNATGINGDQHDGSASAAGAVYVFVRAGVIWSQQAYVKPPFTARLYSAGEAVSLSSEGEVLASGAPWEGSAAKGVGGEPFDDSSPQSGAVYVY